MSRVNRYHSGRWTAALIVTFMLLGVSWSTWLTRFPTLRDELGYGLDDMSILILMPSIGSMLGLILAGRAVERFGAKLVIMLGVVLMGVSLPLGTLTLLSGHVLLSYALLLVFGAGFGFADVAANVSGSDLERFLGRPRLVLVHAGFSVGGIGSVLFGAYAEAVNLPLLTHQITVFTISIALVFGLSVWVPGERVSAPAHEEQHLEPPMGETYDVTMTGPIPVGGPTPKLRGGAEVPFKPVNVWKDPRILLLGFIALSGSLADGVATDWMPLAFIDEYDLTSDRAVLVLTLMFAGALTMRLIGDRLLMRFGRVAVLRMTLAFAFAGILLVALSPWTWLAVPGALFWGAGAALAFPIGISAAADKPETAARGVSVVSTIAYSAYAAGPVIFGFLGEHFGLRVSFLVLSAIIALGFFLSSRAGERE